MTERRNVRADYRRIFGEEPPPVDGVALMTNTGHTEEPLTAYYGDIMFRSAPSDSADQVIGAPLRLSAARDTTR